ncbi:MAG: Methanol oxidation glmU-like protein [Deltaproteobacteria bacterium]|nr:Methanol oxidation glmU-like protein [Deltaproteobacteria bacterium]
MDHRAWRPAHHTPLEPLADGLWQVEAELAGLPMVRRMVIARRADGSVLVHNAVCADEPTMVAIEAIGPIRWLIVPGAYHRLDLAAWNARYPDCTVIAMPQVTPRIRERGRVDGGPELLPPDPTVTYAPLDGVPGEGVLVHRGRGITLVFNDVLQNNGKLPGWKGAALSLLGSGGGPKVTRIARLVMVGDKRALAAHLVRLATPDLTMIVPGHGAVIRDGAAETLRSVARAL